MSNPIELWNKCLAVIKDNLPEKAYKTWFEPIVPVKYENDEFLLQVPSTFFYEYIEDKFAELLRYTLDREIGKNTRLLYRFIVVQRGYRSIDIPTTINSVSLN